MALPKIDVPTFKTKLYSNEQEVTYRPFLVKEEKILYMALEGEDSGDMTRAMKQIIANCVIEDVDLENLPLFDLEHLMLNIRGKSVGESAQVNHICQQTHNEELCNNEIPLNINFEKITLNQPISSEDQSIMITNNIGIMMKYPKVDILSADTGEGNAIENLWTMLETCIDYIFDETDIYQLADYSEGEKTEFFDSLTQEQFGKVRDFFNSIPRLQYKTKYKCRKCGYNGDLTIEGVDSFFV